jgi:N-acetylglutamate synthase-like GNAT family acetyltransferase
MTQIRLQITLRDATAADDATIKNIIREATLNPFGLKWERFVIAEEDSRVVGIGQIKPHEGCRELASIAVIPSHQKLGIGAMIVQELIAREERAGNTVLYLMCLAHNEPFYTRFGFRRIELPEIPRYFSRIVRLASMARRILFFADGSKMSPVIMKRG